MSKPLPVTGRQKQCYDAIARLQRTLGHSPTLEQLREALGLRYRSGVLNILHRLKERGLIDWRPGLACSIELRGGERGFTLPPDLQRRLEGFCARAGEQAINVIADAVALHLDEVEHRVDEIAGGGGIDVRLTAQR